MKNWLVYLLKCVDGTLYCGVTNDLEKRIAAHNAGKGAVYTRGRLPVTLVAQSRRMSRSEALRLEMRVKKRPAAKKAFLLQAPGSNNYS